MASLNDILGSSTGKDKEEKLQIADLIITEVDEHNNKQIVTTNKDTRGRELLFTFDETQPADGNVAYEKIYYLDRTKTFAPTKSLGKYTLKNHQLTTLHFMLGLEKMLFDCKRIIKTNNSNGNADKKMDAKMDIISTHYTNTGILSDKVGAGKSYCLMALINEAKTFHSKQLPFRSIKWGCNDVKIESFNRLDTNILLVPHSLVNQWDKYLASSGLKYYTIQKAKDIFGLADDKCAFKGKKFNMVAKEDDQVVKDDSSVDDGDEPLNDKDQDTKPAPRKKAIGKTKSIVSSDDTGITKKKVVITKRSKAAAAQAAESEAAEIEAGKDVKKSVRENNIEFEKQKRTLAAELTKARKQENDKHNEIYSSGLRWGTPERFKINQELEAIQLEIKSIEKRVAILNDKIKENNLEVGAIKISEIHELHCALEYKTTKELPKSLSKFLENFSRLDKRQMEKYDVILISATFWNLFTLYINQDGYTVNRILVDECNAIKGNRLVEIPRLFTWLVTSSIESMMTDSGYIWKNVMNANGRLEMTREKTVNSTGFIQNMIREIYEHKLDNYKIYLVNRPEYIEESMTLPELKIIMIISKDSFNIQVLQGVVSHDVLQMLNAGDIAGIITKLDVAVGDESNVIEMITRKYQDDLKVKEYDLKVAIENPKYNPKHESQSIINKRDAIRTLKQKIACIQERITEVENCPICYDDFTNPAVTPCCSNKFCFNCIAAALNSKAVCPLCKSELSIKNMIVIKTDGLLLEDPADKDGKSSGGKGNLKVAKPEPVTYEEKLEYFKSISQQYGKYENMDKIFELGANNPVRKYLIFTEYETALNVKVTSILDKWGLTYGRIKGSSLAIGNMVETYRKSNDELNVLLINSKYFGSGLNLENTSDIIILHKMGADIEMQVIGRAHRYGRKVGLRVWKLYYQNEAN